MTIEFEDKPWFLYFSELGEYDHLEYNFRKQSEAIKTQLELIKDCESTGYYTFIAKMVEVRRKEPMEKEQVKEYE